MKPSLEEPSSRQVISAKPWQHPSHGTEAHRKPWPAHSAQCRCTTSEPSVLRQHGGSQGIQVCRHLVLVGCHQARRDLARDVIRHCADGILEDLEARHGGAEDGDAAVFVLVGKVGGRPRGPLAGDVVQDGLGLVDLLNLAGQRIPGRGVSRTRAS